MIWVVGTLVLALLWCLGTIIKLQWQISQLETQLDTQIEALMMLRSIRTSTHGTGTGHHVTELYDSRANAIAAAKGVRCE